MKKIFSLITLVLFSTSLFGQVYTHRTKRDKFDEVLAHEEIRTLIVQTDSTFVIETKGFKPHTYYILNKVEAGSNGSKDNIVNLVNNVWGYEESWCVIREKDAEAYSKLLYRHYNGWDVVDEMQKYWIFITRRVIVTQYIHNYEAEYLWLLDREGNRIIYSK